MAKTKFRLVISDVDSTLIEQEVIDLLAQEAGRGEEVARITAKAMAGELDFQDALRSRVALLKGLPEGILIEIANQISLSPGALELREFCRENEIPFGAVSGGFVQVLESIPFFMGLDYLAANHLEVKDGEITGRVLPPIVDRESKAEHLIQFAALKKVSLSETLAIGDGANDLLLLKKSGFGVAYKAKEILRKEADLAIESDLGALIDVIRG